MPDNTVMRRKLAAMQQAPGTARALGDYPATLPYRVLSTKGGAGQDCSPISGDCGPVTAPVIPGEQPETELSLLRDIKELLRRMPDELLLAMRTQLVLVPREAVSFITMSGTVNVLAGATTVVLAQTIQPRFGGFITKIGVNVMGAGNFPDVTWQLQISGAIHPEFGNRIYSAANLNTPDDFVLELCQSRIVQLVAINTGGVPIDVQAKFVGWTEFLTDNKPYGSSPMSGIA